LRRRWWLVPVRDALAFFLWLASFASNRIDWRGTRFYLRDGRMIPVEAAGDVREAMPDAIAPEAKEGTHVTR